MTEQTDDVDLFDRYEAASALVPAHFGDDEAATGAARTHLIELLQALGLGVLGQTAVEPGGRPYILVVHTSDYNYSSTVYAVPDAAVTSALRSALRVVPQCFAAPDDAYLSCWGDILRLLAVWGLDGLTVAEFHDVMVEDFGADHDHADLPDLAELTLLADAWSAYVVTSVYHNGTATVDAAQPWLGYHYRDMYLFRQSM